MANPKSSKQAELTCFVVIGFGRKTDFSTGRVLDLDLTYQKLIKPAFDKVGIRCFRAIDVNVTGSIDKLMYQWIYHADFVVADLSTMNANVFYELGVRHAQRPNTTLIMAEDGMFNKLPFDLGHTIIYGYRHLGEDIAQEEADRFVGLLSEQLRKLIDKPVEEDSPVYTYLPGMAPPQWIDPKQLIADMQAKLDAQEKMAAHPETGPEDAAKQPLAITLQRAEAAKNAQDYPAAIALFRVASENDPQDQFLKQRLALVTYKGKENDADDGVAIAALQEAGEILETSCSLSVSKCPETLGLGGAINKRLYERSGELEYLDKSIEYYERGFYVKQDYYNGINAAFMHALKANQADNAFDAIANYGHANAIRKKVVEICLRLIDGKDFKNRGDQEWVYQSLAQGYLGLGEMEKVKAILPKIEALSKGGFDMDTFLGQNQKLVAAMEEFKRRHPAVGQSMAAKPGPETALAAPQTDGPISIDLGTHQGKPIKSIELVCKVEFG